MCDGDRVFEFGFRVQSLNQEFPIAARNFGLVDIDSVLFRITCHKSRGKTGTVGYEEGRTVSRINFVPIRMQNVTSTEVSDHLGILEESEETIDIEILGHNWNNFVARQEIDSLHVLFCFQVLEETVALEVDKGDVSPLGARTLAFFEVDGVPYWEYVFRIGKDEQI